MNLGYVQETLMLAMGWQGHRLTQARINDFQRTIGEARWGFYRK